MFALEELDKLLSTIGLGVRRESDQEASGSLKSKPIDPEKFDWTNFAHYLPGSTLNSTLSNKLPDYLEKCVERKDITSLNDLLTALLIPLLLEKLRSVPERHFASARLLVCDDTALVLLNKIRHHLTKHSNTSHACVRDLLYRSPFKVTAILSLQELVDLFDRTTEPIVIVKQQLGRQLANFNYTLIKKLLPYLKVVDLFVCLSDPKGLDLKSFSLSGPRHHQILQYLANFARTSHLIDIEQVCKQTGLLKSTYDNVAIVRLSGSTNDIYLSPNLPALALIAELVVRMANHLKLTLSTIAFRAGDPNGLARVCCNMISSVWKTSNTSQSMSSQDKTRVLIIDRAFDLQSLLYHADAYGPFVEQESATSIINSTNSWADEFDTLAEKLRDVKLTDVLGTALKLSTEVHKSDHVTPQVMSRSLRDERAIQLLSPATATGSLLKQHLTFIKSLYQTLNEGYLIVLRLESSLEELTDQLRTATRPLSPQGQSKVVAKIERVVAALVELTKISGKSIGSLDIARIACIILDIINTFLLIHPEVSKEHARMLKSLRSVLLLEERGHSGLRSSLKSKLAVINQEDESMSSKLRELSRQLNAFNRLSEDFSGSKSTLKLEQIIEGFISQTLDTESFPTAELNTQIQSKQTGPTSSTSFGVRIGVIVVFLGALTPRELAKIKAFEWRSVRTKSPGACGRILVLMSGLCRPENFLNKML